MYTYTVTENSYLIEGNGRRLFQEEILPNFPFPHPRATVEESAQAHIQAIIAAEQTQQQEAVTIVQLQQELTTLKEEQVMQSEVLFEFILSGGSV